MEKIYVEKVIVTEIKFTFGPVGYKTIGNWVYNQQFHYWWDNNLLRVLVVLQVGVTPVATPYLIRCVICCVDGHGWIEMSLDATHAIWIIVLRMNAKCGRNLWCLAMMQSINFQQNSELQIYSFTECK